MQTGLVIGIDDPLVHTFLVRGVHDRECMFSDQFVIAVEEELDVVGMAKIEGCIDNIVGGEQPLLILDKSDSFLTELQFLHKLYGFIHVPVVGHIVDKNNMVVFIFLLQ